MIFKQIIQAIIRELFGTLMLNMKMFVFGCVWICFLYFCHRKALQSSRFDEYLRLYRSISKRGDRMGQNGNEMIIVDPVLIKRVANCIEDRNQPSFSSEDKLTHSIFNLNGEIWNSTRRLLSGTVFASSQLGDFFGSLVECADSVMAEDVFLKDYTTNNNNNNVVDVVRMTREYLHAVVYRCVYGRHKLPPEAEFVAMAKALRHADTFKFWHYSIVPECFRWMWRTKDEVARYFADLTTRQDVMRPDSFVHKFLSLWWSSESGNGQPIDLDSIVQGNCAVFLLGGFTSTSATLAFALFELAKNTGVQDMLYEEVSGNLEDQTFSAKIVPSFAYLRRVVDETLRKYPPFAANARVCSRTYEDDEIRLEKGQRVVIPVCGLHMDERYYDGPDDFKPERFDRMLVRQHVYMPFGLGKRTCIGQRFALLTIKVFLIRFIAKFRLELIAGDFVLPPFVPNKFTTTVNNLPLRLFRR